MPTQTGIAISADGCQIHFWTQGSGSPALLFVHGWCCDHTYWDQQIEHFASRYQVVTIDLAGHGASGRGRVKWTIPAFGQDVEAVVRHLNLGPVVLIGHSMGGPVIVEAARRLGATATGIVGVDTWRQPAQVRTPTQIAESLEPLRANFGQGASARVLDMFVPRSDPALVERIVAAMSSAPPAIGIGAIEGLYGFDQALQEGFRALNIPKVAINSDYRPNDLEAMRSFGIKTQVMPGVGHFVMLEDPQTFNHLLEEAIGIGKELVVGNG